MGTQRVKKLLHLQHDDKPIEVTDAAPTKKSEIFGESQEETLSSMAMLRISAASLPDSHESEATPLETPTPKKIDVQPANATKRTTQEYWWWGFEPPMCAKKSFGADLGKSSSRKC